MYCVLQPLYIIATKTMVLVWIVIKYVEIDQLFHSKQQLDGMTIQELAYVGGVIIP